MQRFSYSFVIALVSAFVISGCSGDVSNGGSSGSGGSGANGGGGMGGAGGAGGGGGGVAGGGGMGTGTACGGFVGMQCGPTEYCDFPDEQCGAADGVGVCKPRPQGCPEFYSPTCGCDGVVYGNSCDAASAGQDVSDLGGCMAPEGTFGCGHSFCTLATEFCQKTLSDVGGMPDSYSCAPLPMACGDMPSCACLGDPCGAPVPGSCVQDVSGGLTFTCPGG